MPETLENVQKVHVAEIVQHGDQLMIPAGMSINQAIDLLRRRQEYENQPTVVSSSFDCFPWDGARALFNVIKRKFGWAAMESVFTFFGPEPPTMFEVAVGVYKVESVPWGRLTLFKGEGHIDTSVEKTRTRYIFNAKAQVLRKHEQFVKDIYAEVRAELAANSIYRGQAVSIRFNKDDGKPLPIPEVKFVDTRGTHPSQLILPESVQAIIDTNLFTPITRMEDCKRFGIPVKRGILLAGAFGVGKTLAAKIAAALAVEHSRTFIYCKRASEFAEAVEFGLQYPPAIVFCEDIDRILMGERTAEMDQILNIIDGVDTKHSEVMIVLTTNEPEKINPAIVRPGRLDAVIDLQKPDAYAAERLIRYYGSGLIDPTADLGRVAKSLAGNIPAVIEEVVKRSKLSALKRTPPGSTNIVVGEIDLAEAVDTMQMQLDLLNPKNTPQTVPLVEAVKPFVEALSMAAKA